MGECELHLCWCGAAREDSKGLDRLEEATGRTPRYNDMVQDLRVFGDMVEVGPVMGCQNKLVEN